MKIRCPHCRNPVEVLNDSSIEDVLCSTCGSSFNLVADETLTHARQPQRRVSHFQLLEKLGTGAFGAVWKATDTELHRRVAVKIPRSEQLTESEATQFLNEARAAAQLNHPNIVAVHEVGRDSDVIYIVSDFIDGVTLADWISAKSMSPREVANLIVKIAEGLHHAHESGVIHRDLKPSNIMVDASGEPYVMDFGLAKRDAAEVTMTLEGKVLGTPAYMAPEQASGDSYNADARSDVYSLGVILFELLTGERPFRGVSRMLMLQVINDEPPKLRKLSASVPRDLETITLKCLEKAPERRYAAASDLADDLRRWLAHEPIFARPVGPLVRLGKWAKRHPAAAALAATIFTALTVILIGGAWYQNRLQTALRAEADQSRIAVQQKALAEQKTDVARRALYAAHINLAFRDLKAANMQSVYEILDAHIPVSQNDTDSRTFEWYYLWRRSHQARKVLSDLVEQPRKIVFSPDGQKMASVGFAASQPANAVETVVRNVDEWTELARLESSDRVEDIAFDSDGSRLLLLNSNSIRAWSMQTSQKSTTILLAADIPDVKSLTCLAPLSDSRIAVGTEDGAVLIVDKEGRRLAISRIGSERPVSHIAWNSVREIVVVASGVGIVALAPLTGDRLAEFQTNASVRAVAVARRGTRVAVSTSATTIVTNGSVRESAGDVLVWDLPMEPEASTLDNTPAKSKPDYQLKGHQDAVYSLAFLADGRLATASYDRTVRLWDVERQREFKIFRGHTAGVSTIAYSESGRIIASGSEDKTIRIWDLSSTEEVEVMQPVGLTIPIQKLAYSSDSRLLAIGWADAVRLLDATTKKTLRQLDCPGQVSEIAFSQDATLVAACTMRLGFPHLPGDVLVWRTASGERVATLPKGNSKTTALAFTQEGRMLVTASSRGDLAGWSFDGSEFSKAWSLDSGGGFVYDLVCSPDGKTVATTSADGNLRLWDLASREPRTLSGHGKAVTCVAFSPNGKQVASGSADRLLKLWDVSSGKEIATLAGHTSTLNGIAFSSDGKTLISAAKQMIFWDPLLMQQRTSLEMPFRSIRSFSVRPDNEEIAAAEFGVRWLLASPRRDVPQDASEAER